MSSLLHGLFSSCSKQGATLGCGVGTSHCGGSSCCGAGALGAHGLQLLGHVGSRARAYYLPCMGLVALWHVEASQSRDESRVLCLAGGFLPTAPPGKPRDAAFLINFAVALRLLVQGPHLEQWGLGRGGEVPYFTAHFEGSREGKETMCRRQYCKTWCCVGFLPAIARDSLWTEILWNVKKEQRKKGQIGGHPHD